MFLIPIEDGIKKIDELDGVEAIWYSDKIYTSNSIFCSKGQSYTVKGKDVKNHMHCEINNYLGDKNE